MQIVRCPNCDTEFIVPNFLLDKEAYCVLCGHQTRVVRNPWNQANTHRVDGIQRERGNQSQPPRDDYDHYPDDYEDDRLIRPKEPWWVTVMLWGAPGRTASTVFYWAGWIVVLILAGMMGVAWMIRPTLAFVALGSTAILMLALFTQGEAMRWRDQNDAW